MGKKNLIPLSKIEELREFGFDRIADRIQMIWGTPELTHYFNKILISDRDKREGFPIPVFDIILDLYNIHEHEILYGDWRDNFER